MYYSEGSGFWVLRGDGRAPPDDDDWHKLRFDTYDGRGLSYLTNAGQLSRLYVQPNPQDWADLLLPDIYHSRIPATPQRPGGLVGELPIFLGLMAFTMTPEHLQGGLPYTFVDGYWRTHPWQAPRTHCPSLLRGMLITDGTRDPQAWHCSHGVHTKQARLNADGPV
jgi:hypothetical protein